MEQFASGAVVGTVAELGIAALGLAVIDCAVAQPQDSVVPIGQVSVPVEAAPLVQIALIAPLNPGEVVPLCWPRHRQSCS